VTYSFGETTRDQRRTVQLRRLYSTSIGNYFLQHLRRAPFTMSNISILGQAGDENVLIMKEELVRSQTCGQSTHKSRRSCILTWKKPSPANGPCSEVEPDPSACDTITVVQPVFLTTYFLSRSSANCRSDMR
jgi:hypothetical protein